MVNNKSNSKSFNEKCYELLKQVPKGKITTYKELANALQTRAYRAVGNAMNKNPYAPEVPCHRVVNSDGNLGGFAYGDEAKIELLEKEGIQIDKKTNKIKNFKEVLHKFT